jgi:hypothetical protein
VQSPLELPDSDTAETSRNTRIFSFDAAAQKVTAERVYRMEDVTSFDPSIGDDQSEMKISSLAMPDADHLLVDERTDNVARIYTIDLRKGTNVLGRGDDPSARPTLEQLDKDALEKAGHPTAEGSGRRPGQSGEHTRQGRGHRSGGSTNSDSGQ